MQDVGLSPTDAMKNADHVKSVIAALRRVQSPCIYVKRTHCHYVVFRATTGLLARP